MADTLLFLLLQYEAGVKPIVRIFDDGTGELMLQGDLEDCYQACKRHPSWEITAVNSSDGIRILELYVDNTYEKWEGEE